MNTEQCYAEIG